MILINSPNNPTGAVYTPDELERIIKFAEKMTCGFYLMKSTLL